MCDDPIPNYTLFHISAAQRLDFFLGIPSSNIQFSLHLAQIFLLKKGGLITGTGW